jgi:hypothetical protein
MQGVEVATWKWLAVAALSLASCRAHRELCEGEVCGDLPTEVQGGSADEALSGLAGSQGSQGGRASQAEPLCADDATCDDGRVCNGLERCVDERCLPGVDVDCRHGTECVEAAPEPCIYTEPSPWVVATSAETLLGLPLDELENGAEMAVLAHRERTAALTGFDHVWWSPNGKVALVRSFEDRMGSRMHLLRFGAGLPSELESIPDLPNWGNYWDDPVFSADSKRVLIVDTYSGSYVVDLTDEGRPTTLGSIDGGEMPELAIEALCADATSWVTVDENYNHFLTSDSGGEPSSIPLGQGSVTLSPDAQLLAVEVKGEDEDDKTVELRPCSQEAWVAQLGPGYRLEFSSDSQAIALQLTEYNDGMSVLSLADPQSPTTIWSSALAGPPVGPWFTPDGSRLMMMLRETKDDDPTVQVLNLTNGEIQPLGFGPYARVVAVGGQALLAWSVDFTSEPRDLLWQAFDREEEPVLILSDSAAQETSLESVRFDPKSVFVSRYIGGQTEFGTLRFDASAPESARPIILPGSVGRLETARDRRAILVSMVDGFVPGKLFWISYSERGEADEARILLEDAYFLSIQP